MTGGRVLVTGGAGFIGSHVTDLLLARGYEVEVLDDLSTGRLENVSEGVRFHRLDAGSAAAAELVREGRFDAVCHLAAQIDVRKSVADPAADARQNIAGSLNLLEAVRASGRPCRFVFSSTGGAIYGDFAAIPTPETAPKDPQSPYGVAKLSVELYLAYYARVHGLDTVALRYSNVYGPRQRADGEAGVVAIFCGRVLEGRPITVYGDGRQTRDYVFVEDVARANLAALQADLPPAERLDSRSFNIGTGVETSVLQLAELLGGVAERSIDIQYAPPRPGEQLRSALDVSKARQLLGWQPEVELEEGLRRTLRYFSELDRSVR
ncbi:MAG TPA: GDP-mannose 4,6-dehydratase [Gemmatimonadaceae bacterium]|nr:GDP-mannose 4,6-dehydratase [Gemmatimonadaceae bacterium]